MASLSTQSYWDSYYAQSPHPHFDWYLPSDTVLHHVLSTLQQLPYSIPTTSSPSPSPFPSSPLPPPTPACPSPLRLLQLGCGSSSLTTSLAPLYPHITNVDFSPTLIHSLTQLPLPTPLTPPLPPTVTFHCLDVRALPFPSSTFHLLLDKGTLDCVWLGGGGGVERMLDEAERLLVVGGVLMCFSLYGYEDRMELMEWEGGGEEEGQGEGEGEGGDDGQDGREGRRRRRRRRRRGWKVMYHVLQGPLEVPHQQHTYLYVCAKLADS